MISNKREQSGINQNLQNFETRSNVGHGFLGCRCARVEYSDRFDVFLDAVHEWKLSCMLLASIRTQTCAIELATSTQINYFVVICNHINHNFTVLCPDISEKKKKKRKRIHVLII